MITVATDGSLLSTAGSAQFGAWAWQREDGVWAAGSIIPRQGEVLTSTMMENEALRQAMLAHRDAHRLELLTDYLEFVRALSRPFEEWEGVLDDLRDTLRLAVAGPKLSGQHVKAHSGHGLSDWADYHASSMSHAALSSGTEVSMVGRMPVGLLGARREEGAVRKKHPDLVRLRPMFAVTIAELLDATGTNRDHLRTIGLISGHLPTPRALRRRLALRGKSGITYWDLKRTAEYIAPEAFRAQEASPTEGAIWNSTTPGDSSSP